MIGKLIGSVMFGLAAYYLARGVGIPHWYAPADGKLGDACDIGVLAGVGLLMLAGWGK